MRALVPLLWVAVVSVASALDARIYTSDVEGATFSRFIQIWLENTDYEKAAGDENMKWLASKGISLTNYFALTHPSQPNYLASISGEYFGLNDDEYVQIDDVLTIVDLLDAKNISWSTYQEDMPEVGFARDWPNPETQANMYVRKHNPFVSFTTISSDPERMSLVKPLTHFASELSSHQLPQWIFITPNMTSDGHDSSIAMAAEWARAFLEPLLADEYASNNTLVLLTFDENHTYTRQNRIFSLLLGGAVPQDKAGTEDTNFYNHYSIIASTCANWGLPTLGRRDAGANVFALVAEDTGDEVRELSDLSDTYLNESYYGPLNDERDGNGEMTPNVALKINGREVLEEVWQLEGINAGEKYASPYRGQLNVDSFMQQPEETEVQAPAGGPDGNTKKKSEMKSRARLSLVRELFSTGLYCAVAVGMALVMKFI